jgi:DNA-binding NtrC family response regulator
VPKLVLLVHTDADIRDEVAAALRQAGYDVIAYAGTLPAIGALEGDRMPDLLITRTKYPPGNPSGLSLARMALTKCRGIKILITGAPELKEYAAGLGEFHPHPIDVPQLVATVGRPLKSTRLPE